MSSKQCPPSRIGEQLPRCKVVFLLHSVLGGGTERVLLTLLRHLSRRDFEFHVAALVADPQFLSALPKDVTPHSLRAQRLRYVLPELVRLIWQIRPHVVLSSGSGMNQALLTARPFLPASVRFVVRESTTLSADLLHHRNHPKLQGFLCRWLYSRADAVICPSDSIANDLVEHFQLSRGKLVRIGNPVDVSQLHELAGTPISPYSGPGPHVVAVARLAREKGLDVLIDAIGLARLDSPNIELTLIGAGPVEHELRAQASRLGLNQAVRFLGFQPNPWPYMRHADLFVLPSRYEGLSNALLEALALGTLVVATDCPSAIRDVRATNPELRLVPPDDPIRLAQAIVAACKPTERPRITVNQEPARLAQFNLQSAVEAYSALLRGATLCR